MNILVTAAHARRAGLGSFGEDSFGGAIGSAAGDIFGSGSGGGGGRGFDWMGFANTVGGTLSNIFGNRNSSSAALQQQAALLAAQQAAAAAAARGNTNARDDDDSGGGLGIRFEDGHLRIGERTKISYSTLMIGGLALFLIQSPGFTRKGRG